jgi:hypothetical protein
MIVDTMTGDNSDTTLTLSVAPVSENNVQVYFDGVYQSKANYSISGTTLTFSTAPATGVAVEAITHTQTTINEPAANTVTPTKIAAGDFYFDTDTLYIDATNNRVGINTTSPARPLHTEGTGVLFANTGGTHEILFGDNAYRYFGLYTPSSPDYMSIRTGSTDLLTVTSGGNVGIGTTSPSQKLHIGGSGFSYLRTTSTSYGGTGCDIGQHTGGSIYLNNRDNTPIIFQTNNIERMRVQSYGTVCINCTGPAISSDTKLAVLGSGTDGSVAIECRKSTTTTSSAQRFIRFFANDGSTSMGGIAGNGASNVQFVAISDERLKENIQPLSGSLDKVLALNPISYNWKDSGEYIEAGFVAQEVEQVLPEYVTTEEDEDQTKGLTGGMTAGYISVLTKAIQEQQALIEAQATTITDLTTRIETLENA